LVKARSGSCGAVADRYRVGKHRYLSAHNVEQQVVRLAGVVLLRAALGALDEMPPDRLLGGVLVGICDDALQHAQSANARSDDTDRHGLRVGGASVISAGHAL